MKITDACVYSYPVGDSSVRRLALEAHMCGFDSIVVADAPAANIHGIDVIPGIFLTGIPAREVQARVKKSKGSSAIVSVRAGDNGFNRAIVGTAGVHILRDISCADKKAFDHVAAKMAADNTTAIDINLFPLIFGRGHFRQKAIHRYIDLMVLYRRFEFPITISSSAQSVLGLRTVREVTGLCSRFGMDEIDVEKALAGVSRVTAAEDMAVKVIR